MSDLISRQAAIDCEYQVKIINDIEYVMLSEVQMKMRKLPSAQPEPAIPLSWIEGQIGWLKGLDNAFSTLTAGQILAMMNKWKDEQNG